MTINPLDHPGTAFELELMNPNPTSSKTKAGPVYRVSFELKQDDWQQFMDAKTEGMIILAKATVYADQDQQAAPQEAKQGQWGKEAQTLRQSGFFRVPDVWKVIGTDDQFLDWLKTQKCAAHRQGDCTGQVVPAHVRRVADGAGTGIKPPYSAIPLCHHHHSLQHNEGETALGGKGWFDQQRIYWLEKWSWETLKAKLAVESFTEVDPLTLFNWAKENGVDRYLPKVYQL